MSESSEVEYIVYKLGGVGEVIAEEKDRQNRYKRDR